MKKLILPKRRTVQGYRSWFMKNFGRMPILTNQQIKLALKVGNMER